MAKVKCLDPTAKNGQLQWMFKCPGCNKIHCFWTKGLQSNWEFNGNVEKPTVSPSILLVGHDFRCHSFIKDGNIEFCDDCSHSMAGKTVELEEL